ncbi:MAG TPA: hypothetical protein EYP60_07775 [bacterium (Candidatus Stahlbacteria)]|nr:hypothetical protein [Candidatus Stahlbacteria bacterium]
MAIKIFVNNKRIIALLLVAILFATPILSQVVVSDYVQGRRDGRREGAGDASMIWAVVGFGCGCCGVGAAYLWPQAVPAARLVGKSPEYVRGYTSSYKNAKREKETIYAAVGCIVSDIISIIYYLVQPPTVE